MHIFGFSFMCKQRGIEPLRGSVLLRKFFLSLRLAGSCLQVFSLCSGFVHRRKNLRRISHTIRKLLFFSNHQLRYGQATVRSHRLSAHRLLTVADACRQKMSTGHFYDSASPLSSTNNKQSGE